MSESDLPRYVTNHGLFQDYYLTERLPEASELFAAEADGRAFLTAATLLWQRHVGGFPVGEANVTDFVRAVCALLGLAESLKETAIQNYHLLDRWHADLTFFGDLDARDRFADVGGPGDAARYAEALTIAELEPYGADLDKVGDDHRSPSRQIVDYLTFTGVPWGILTDGGRWRLYRRTDPPRTDHWLQIDLVAVLALPEPEDRLAAARAFVTFFRSSALRRQPDGRCALDRIADDGQRHAAAIQQNLRGQAFAVVEELAQGIHVTTPGLPLMTIAGQAGGSVYEYALVVLYRLLFCKFAEDLGILPVENPAYQQTYGFGHLQDEMLNRLERQPPTLGDGPQDTTYWERLGLPAELAIPSGLGWADVDEPPAERRVSGELRRHVRHRRVGQGHAARVGGRYQGDRGVGTRPGHARREAQDGVAGVE